MTGIDAGAGGSAARWIRPRSSLVPASRPGRRRAKVRMSFTAWAFVLPAFGLTAIFSIVPLVLVVRRSLYRGNIFDTDLTFAGVANYRNVFITGGGHALWVTLVYTVGFVVVCMVSGLGLALLLNMPLRGLTVFRAMFIIPLVVPPVATAFIWFALFQPGTGLFNRILSDLGLPQVSLSQPTVALIAVIAFGGWQFFGEVVVLFLAALKALPGDVMEAATVDGASAWKLFRFIRLPLLRPQTALIATVATLNGLQAFTQIFVLTGGGPNGATETALYYEFNQAFGLGAGGSIGRADAMAVMIFVISMALTVVQVAVVGRAADAVRS